MLLVVADTSPIRYLVQIDQIKLLPLLFERILVPSAVAEELRHPLGPPSVKAWIAEPPDWIDIRPAPDTNDPVLLGLDPGERCAIALGLLGPTSVIRSPC